MAKIKKTDSPCVGKDEKKKKNTQQEAHTVLEGM